MLLRDPISKHNFRCKVCQCTLELGNMGKGALVKHTKSAKHVKNSEELNSASAGILASWARPASSTCSTSSNNSVAGSTSETIVVQDDSTPSTSNPWENWAIADDVLRAEIFSTMNHAVNHHSYNSSKHSSVLFETMFPDSKIAKQFACGPSKMAYMTSFGLAPYPATAKAGAAPPPDLGAELSVCCYSLRDNRSFWHSFFTKFPFFSSWVSGIFWQISS